MLAAENLLTGPGSSSWRSTKMVLLLGIILLVFANLSACGSRVPPDETAAMIQATNHSVKQRDYKKARKILADILTTNSALNWVRYYLGVAFVCLEQDPSARNLWTDVISREIEKGESALPGLHDRAVEGLRNLEHGRPREEICDFAGMDEFESRWNQVEG